MIFKNRRLPFSCLYIISIVDPTGERNARDLPSFFLFLVFLSLVESTIKMI